LIFIMALTAFCDLLFRSKDGGSTMMKYILALVLIAPLMTVSGMAQNAPRVDQHVYQGGPKSSVPHTTRLTTTTSDAFAMMPRGRTAHVYSGGPQTVVPHRY
jgi:hypothetical protein